MRRIRLLWTDNPVAILCPLVVVALCLWLGRSDIALPVVLLIALVATGALLLAFVPRQEAASSPFADSTHALRNRVRRTDMDRRSAIFDDTTNLYHRWYLELRLLEEAERCKRYNYPIAVVVVKTGEIDISSFSLDGWREEAAATARKATTAVRNVDLPAALSPVEYAICLIYCDRQGADRALSRLVQSLPHRECEGGIAVFPDDGCAPDALIDLARARMRPIVLAGHR